ncbi:PAS domain S-box protein [Alcaligenaceae bacterium]|nr:PAS domain S-box protein [Alcaligenaceae bacterium]
MSDQPVSYSVLHQRAMERLGPPTVLIDHAFRIVHLSASAGRYLRHVGGEPSHHLLTLVNPALRADLRATAHEALKKDQTVQSKPMPFPDGGQSVQLRIAVSPFHDTDTSQHLLLVVFEELHGKNGGTAKTKQELLDLISSTDILTVLVDGSMRVKWFTPQAVRLFDLKPADAGEGRPLQDLPHRLIYPDLLNDVYESFKSLRVIEREIKATDKHWYLTKIRPYRSADDRIEGVIMNFVDISERVKAQEALREGVERLRLIAENTKDFAIISMDPTGHVTGWNRAAELIFGYSEDDMQGQTLDRIFTPEDRASGRPAEELRLACEQGHAEDERWHLRKDGSRFYCSGVVYPLMDGELKGYAKIARDLTDKCLEDYQQQSVLERWKETNVLKDQFIAIMSHELRHPLNLIQLNMELLARSPEIRTDPKAVAALDAVRRAVHNQSQIIEDLLDLSRVQTGKLKLQVEPVPVQLILHTVLDAVSTQAREAGVTLHGPRHDTDTANLIVHGDASRIEQIVWNLLSNAIKFTPTGGTVTVTLAREGDEARIDVQDTGVGIPSEAIEKVFTMFGQVERHTQGNHNGLGIGLALVEQLAQAHGGRVRAQSPGEGLGSTFTIWLPLAGHESPQEDHPMPSSSGTLEGLRLLLVDDSEEIVSMLATLCEMEGAQVHTALDGQQALELLESFDFDILITDLGMPVMDGYTLLTRLRSGSRNADIPAIALTGYGYSEKAQLVGFTDQLCKPVPMKRLLEKLTEAVTQRRTA